MTGITGPTGLDERIDIHVVNGVEGPSIYLNGFRIAGNKPWGGGSYLYKLQTTGREVLYGLVGRPHQLPPTDETPPSDALEWHHWHRRRETPVLLERISDLAKEGTDADTQRDASEAISDDPSSIEC